MTTLQLINYIFQNNYNEYCFHDYDRSFNKIGAVEFLSSFENITWRVNSTLIPSTVIVYND